MEHQICPTCGEGWAEKPIAGIRGFAVFNLTFKPELVNWEKIEDSAELIAKELAAGTPDFPFDDMLAGFTSEVVHEFIGSHTHPAEFVAALADLSSAGGQDKKDKIKELLKGAGINAIPAWLLNLLLPLAIDAIQKLIEKWFKK